jgi:ferredoxin-like protein FixX
MTGGTNADLHTSPGDQQSAASSDIGKQHIHTEFKKHSGHITSYISACPASCRNTADTSLAASVHAQLAVGTQRTHH